MELVPVTTNLDGILAGLLDNMRDQRVANAIRRDFLPGLRAEVEAGFLLTLHEKLGPDSRELDDLPDEGKTSVGATLVWLSQHHPALVEPAMEGIARLASQYLRDNRAAIIDSMRAAGEGPTEDREARIAQAREKLASAEAATQALEARGQKLNPAEVHQAVEPIVEMLEACRELLVSIELDDALTAAPGPDGQPPPVAADVEELSYRSWLAEADLHCCASDRVGPQIHETDVCTPDQEPFLLDAIVALQEAVQIRLEIPVALHLARLRLAKGDVGEARAICERIHEIATEDRDKREASEILDRVSVVSPLGKKTRKCFVATAALGDADAPEVATLRRWRDSVLLSCPAGRAAVAVYERLSPPLAELIARCPVLRRAVRDGLVRPLAWIIGRTGR